MPLHHTVKYRTVQYGTVQYRTVPYRTILYYIQHQHSTGTVRYDTVLQRYWNGTLPLQCCNPTSKTVRFLAWRTKVRWEEERRTEDGWYPGRKRRFSFLGSPAKRYISREGLPTNRTTYGWMCSSRFAQVSSERHRRVPPCPRNQLTTLCNYCGSRPNYTP